MSEPIYIPAEALVKMIRRLMQFPYPQICRHLVAANLLSCLEDSGMEISQELARAVVQADDDKAILLLDALIP